MKKYIAIFVSMLLLSFLALAGCNNGQDTASNEEVITIKVGHISPPEHSFSIGFNQFAEAVEKETGGKVKFEIFGNGQLGGEKDLTEQVQLGTLDMTLVTTAPVTNFVPEIGVLDLPFLFRDLDHAYATLDGEIGEELLNKLENSGFKGLGFWENGLRHISNNKKEIRTPDDFVGLKMRTLENEVFVDTYKALGADPTPIAFPEVFTSFQQGVADGSDFSYGVFESTNMNEVQDYFSEVGIYYAAAVLLMNLDTFNALPADIQDVFVRLGKEYASVQRQLTQDMEVDQKQRIIDQGVQVINADEIDLEAFKKAVEPVYDKYADRYGDYVERIRSVQ